MPASSRRKAKKSNPKKTDQRGIFLTVEGGEGAGKTTQIELLKRALEARGRTVTVTKEPGGSILANHIRALLLDEKMKGLVPLAELFLYEASRAQHIADLIEPALEKGQVVICDRFADSSVVYQGVARGLERSLVEKLNQVATGGLKPHRTLVLDLDPAVGLERAKARGTLDRMEKEGLAFHQAVRQGFRALVRREPKRVKLVSALGTAEQVHERVLRALEDLWK